MTLILTSCSKKVSIMIEQNEPVVKEKDITIHNDSLENIKIENNHPVVLIEPENQKSSPDPLLEAEYNASDAGKAILEIGRKMVFEEKTIVKGSCWDYINEVFKRAGYGTNKTIVFKSVKSGPYADISQIKPGDWLYYINYSYYGVEHSGIFVYWKDYENKIGVTLSYGGEKRNEPGRYREYDLKSVYYITRPGTN
jgi:hypothetical protein